MFFSYLNRLPRQSYPTAGLTLLSQPAPLRRSSRNGSLLLFSDYLLYELYE